ncbi:hypothetical protein Cni_G06433 [Canna indica]|uniref:DUF1639 family protein n=1 Tax=Canna indica TaxID=4628 RepID=A0AAQ3Q406_9LILI|nr:hypothetical protein Cni_G06433 [Canna indica]
MVFPAGEEEAGRVAALERPAASAILPYPPLPPRRPRSRLHYFSFTTGNWRCQRVLHCSRLPLGANSDGAGILACSANLSGAQAASSQQPSPRPKSDMETERKGREEAYAERSFSHPAAVAAEAEGAYGPWNLRTRRAACNGPAENPTSCIPNSILGCPSSSAAEKIPKNCSAMEMVKGASDASTKGKHPQFSVSLTREEIMEDFLAITGRMPPRRPKKRPRSVRRQLESLYPGQWLSKITPATYKVDE